MDSVPLYITLGSIAGFLSVCVLFILHFPEVVNRIKQFIEWLRKYLKRIPRMIRKWWWWRQRQPTWRAVGHGDIKIEQSINGFILSIPVEIEYHNSDERYELQIHRYPQILLHHLGRGIAEGRVYELHSSSVGYITIAKSQTMRIGYTADTTLSVEPLLGEKAVCEVKDRGDAYKTTNQGLLWGEIKRMGSNKFVAKINK